MSDLVRHYREYYREQTPKAFDSLFACMLEYDFSSYREDMRKVYIMHGETKCMGECATLKSGGSFSGEGGSFYEFGPNFDHVRFSIETFLRLGHFRTILLADPGFGSLYSVPPKIDVPEGCSWYHMSIAADWSTSSSLDSLEIQLKSLFDIHGPINISSLFSLWLFLSNDLSFRDFVSRNRHKINALVNSDGSPTFNEMDCRTHDQMMDWPSGTNFYQCDFGGMHFLPLFFSQGGINSSLINLKRNSRPFDDSFVLNNAPTLCRCGRMAIQFSFLPHSSNAPIDSGGYPVDFSLLPRLMWPGVYSFQVLQEFERTIVFYSCREGSESGLSRPLAFLEGSDVGKIDATRARYFAVGRKRQTVWRGGSPVFYDFFERRVPWQPSS